MNDDEILSRIARAEKIADEVYSKDCARSEWFTVFKQVLRALLDELREAKR